MLTLDLELNDDQVRFLDSAGKAELFGASHVRYVDPDGQDDPEAYLKVLNP